MRKVEAAVNPDAFIIEWDSRRRRMLKDRIGHCGDVL